MSSARLQRIPRVQTMINLLSYPYLKVVFGFSLCPTLIGLLAGPLGIIFGNNPGGLYGLDLAIASITAAALAAVTATGLYFIPALLLSIVYAQLKLTKSFLGYTTVFLGGGVGAVLWGILLSQHTPEKGYFEKVADVWLTQPSIDSFLMGAISSVVMAWLVLPNSKARIAPGLVNAIRKDSWDWENQAPNDGVVAGSAETTIVKAGVSLDRYGLRKGEYMSPTDTPYGRLEKPRFSMLCTSQPIDFKNEEFLELRFFEVPISPSVPATSA